MGLLVDGEWKDQWYDTDSTGGRFERSAAAFRNWITADGSAGPEGVGGFKAEPDRYHLYVAYACPWAHRALVFRKLKKLEGLITVSVVNPIMREHGWTFRDGYKVVPDPIHNAQFLHQVYTAAKSDYSGRVTVPVIWDKQQETIVSNESADIIRMFNSAFDAVGAAEGDFYPPDLREPINEINAVVYDNVNNGVYKTGFATTQQAYEEAVVPLFETLDALEKRLDTQRYLCGERLTEADWRLFTTLIRFDAVYVGHFKCNIRRIDDYPNLSNYVRELYQMPGIAETVELRAIKMHYYGSHDTINPHYIIPMGPALDFHRPHDRAIRFPAR
ncbi:glutathione S-transferase family protein [Wenzhouxiangella limi]|uniref:Glutathione S-transferase family protein n=1 Tax=Wenzhouxiangella limi TaxID=2707351 RepID=A0A845UUI6_9GAMM|nr:glutathione S-transferase family protein [Wenzhouxiangella limi]NDY95167.1 glutathione S-transferase family protein [Wenzhouxiangella limi]